MLLEKKQNTIDLDITVEEIDFAESSFKQLKEYIDFYIKNGNHHFTKSKKVINATVGCNGVRTSGLKILK